jgi:hypothetical protein
MGLTTTFGDNPQVFPTARRHYQYAMQALRILFSRCAFQSSFLSKITPRYFT